MNRFTSALDIFVQVAQFWVAALGVLWLVINPIIGLCYILLAFMSQLGSVFARVFVLAVATIDLAYLLFLLGQLLVTWVLAHVKTMLFILALLLVGGFALYKIVQYYRSEYARIQLLKDCYAYRITRFKALTNPAR